MKTTKLAHPMADPASLGKASCEDCDIRHMVMFAVLPEGELTELLKPIDIVRFDAQERIYPEQTDGFYAFTIRSGVIKLLKAMPNGDVRIVRLLTRGDTFGLEVLLQQKYHHSAIAITGVELCRIPVSVLNALDERSPEFHHLLMARWQKSVDAAEAFITDLSTGHAKTRLAHLLLNFFSDGLSEVWNSPARDDIAHMMGLTIETTSRLMAEFKREGLISEEHGIIAIQNTEALRAIAEE